MHLNITYFAIQFLNYKKCEIKFYLSPCIIFNNIFDNELTHTHTYIYNTKENFIPTSYSSSAAEWILTELEQFVFGKNLSCNT